ncbi:MAG TPA: ribosome-associated translation inhibitor RaiA [Edaphocola sp.]|nr:ribosome-associated translation inhibitor RaiA [Edaphocola sp.]
MKFTENLTGINLNFQAVDITIGEDLKDNIRKSISRLQRHYNKIEWVDIYLQDKKDKKDSPKHLSIRLGVPGNDPFASEYGNDFHALVTSVEEKLRRQLEKRDN